MRLDEVHRRVMYRKQLVKQRKRDMTREEICNVQPVSTAELFEASKLLAVAWANEKEVREAQARWTVADGKEVV